MDGRTVQSFVTSSGDGLAYAAGPTVVIGYVVPSNSIAHGLDPAATQESAKGAYTTIMAKADGKPLSDRFMPGTGPASYPLARGRYTTPGDPGWLYFRTTDFKGATPKHFGIAPGGTMAGCDVVPSEQDHGDANQTVVDTSGPAHYSHSDTKTFTRDIDELVPGTDSKTVRRSAGWDIKAPSIAKSPSNPLRNRRAQLHHEWLWGHAEVTGYFGRPTS